MNAIEQLRKKVIQQMMSLDTIKNVWPTWKVEIQGIVKNTPPDHKDLMKIGDSLYQIFKKTSQAGRSQSSVSGGGTAWEVLVCWYLNLCLIGSRTVVVRARKEHVPEPISDSITVLYGKIKSNTESDLLAITFPDTCFNNKNNFLTTASLKNYLEMEITNQFKKTELTVIQCKTNWNDNAQIPMLWDLIYRSTGFGNAATVGINNFINSGLGKFTYAFATVPTVDHKKIKSNSTCVLRVNNLSGGNYWGLPSNNTIALNIFELISKNFQTSLSAYKSSWNSDIAAEVNDMYTNQGNYFLL